MDMKERLRIPPQAMPEQDPGERVHNVLEVPLGFTPEAAIREAQRCVQCKTPFCVEGCPVAIDIPGFVKAIEDGDFAGAIAIIKKNNLLPAVCGRVCPQEEQCQLRCAVGKAMRDPTKAVAIGRLERFVADWERGQGEQEVPPPAPATGRRVAVVGSGPAGLTVAGDLVRMGHAVTVFEALHKAGGVLVYGIPEFRLPKVIVQKEVDYLEKLGVEFRYNSVIGLTRSVQDVLDEYDAIFIGTGAGLPKFMRVPGENLLGVYSANEYLTRANLMRAYEFPASDTPILRASKVATVGGGNVAMDCARTALRLGAERSLIVYRRSEAEMPARVEEVHHAREEGVEFNLLRNPVRVLGNDEGWVCGIELIEMELGEPDASGRRRPVPREGSEFVEEVDAVIVAIGNSPNPLVPKAFPELEVTTWGGIVVNEATGQTSARGVFAGGDIVLGAATVILAMGHGRIAARAIDAYLATGRWEDLEEVVSVMSGTRES
ncbi:NADPH-dependent glutamate synthase [Candidatus Fermentibacterales bacterium]|nr:NADPH-dependent glutamate synthase [Candidatus Fermentibacterales bacterium]